MKNTGIFYGSTTGTTERIAHRLAAIAGVSESDIHNIAETAPSVLGDYDIILAGTSTWRDGTLQEDWYDFIDGASALDLQGHKIAVFGCGDETMSETFCNAMGTLYHRLRETGAEMFGQFPADCYDFNASKAKAGDRMVGLALDEVNHPDLSENRIAEWVKTLEEHLSMPKQ